MRYVIAVGLLLLVSSGACFARTSYELRDECRSSNALNQIECLAYLEGVIDGFMSVPIKTDDGQFCMAQLDSDMKMGQIAEMFNHYMDEHPESLNLNPATVMPIVLSEYHKLKYVPGRATQIGTVTIGK